LDLIISAARNGPAVIGDIPFRDSKVLEGLP